MATENDQQAQLAALQGVTESLRQMVTGMWSEELKAQDLRGIVGDIDRALNDNPDDPHVRLFWVLAQSETSSVPVAALTGPLDESYHRLDSSPSERALAALVFISLGRKLFERKQSRLSVSLFDRGWEIVQQELALPSAAKRSLWLVVVELFEEELKRAQVRREPKVYSDGLHNRLAQIRAAEPKVAAKPEILPTPKAGRGGWSSKAIIERAIDVPTSPSPTESSASIDELTAGSATAIRELPKLALMPEKRSGPRFVNRPNMVAASIGFLAVAIVVASAYLLTRSVDFEGIDERLAMSLGSDSLSTELLLPRLSVAGTVSTSALESVTRRLESMKVGNGSSGEKTEAADPEIDRKALEFEGNLPPPPPPQPNVRNEPTQIPTAGQRLPGSMDQRKLPQLDTRQLESAVLESLGAIPGAGEAAGGVVRGGDGRVYGPPLGRAGSDGVALDGSPLKAYPVEQLQQPVLYRVIASTKVLSDPTVVGSVIAELKADALVQVVSRMGNWLEIQSSGGRRGFIYAQDAAIAEN